MARQYITLTFTYTDATPHMVKREADFALRTVGAEALAWAEERRNVKEWVNISTDVIFVNGIPTLTYTSYWRYWPVDSMTERERKLFESRHLRIHYGTGQRVAESIGFTFATNPHAPRPRSKVTVGQFYREHKQELDSRLFSYVQSLRAGNPVQTFVRGEREQRMYGGGKAPLKSRPLLKRVRSSFNSPKSETELEQRIGERLVRLALALQWLREKGEQGTITEDEIALHGRLLERFQHWQTFLKKCQIS